MHHLIIALSIGLAGSLHCIGMCGPLVSALHVGGALHMKRSLIYHGGRILGYALFGAVMGVLGYSMRLVVTQEWLALIAGSILLITFLWPSFLQRLPTQWGAPVRQLRQKWMQWWHTGHPGVVFGMGMLNAFLPCGLVYSALAASIITASPWMGALFMALFGLANTPALFFSAQIIRMLQERFGHRHKRHIQIILMAFAFLIVLRGAGLGIPLVSPKISNTENTCCRH
jgi:uncharacterized protein